MSLYHIVFLLLLVGALIEYKKQETPKVYFYVSFAVLTLMLCLRVGQGTDYFSYNLIYHSMPLRFLELFDYTEAKAEIGWRFLCMVFRRMNFSFKGFVVVISLAEMALFWRFLSRHCKNRMLALLISYHTLYLTYFFSAMRQGLVLAIFLGILLEWLMEGKYLRYCIVAVLCSTIHSVSLICLLPVFVHFIKISFPQMVCIVIAGFAVGIWLSVIDITKYLYKIVELSYFETAQVSAIAAVERFVSYAFVAIAFYSSLDGKAPDYNSPMFKLFKVYSLGILMYGLLMWSSLISSRMVYAMKLMEIVLVSSLMLKNKKVRLLVFAYWMMVSSVMYVKNMMNYVYEGDYQNVSWVNFPYVNTFNEECILDYRTMDEDNMEWWLVELAHRSGNKP